jgi:hypothetical protein
MKKIALTPRSKELIKNYILGGAALGGSGALLSSLINYINTLKAQTADDENKEDDETLYLDVGKQANESSGLSDLTAGGLAISGGILSTLGTYALVRKLYQNIKKKQLQEQLDRAQQEFLGSAEEEAMEAQKKAATGQAMDLGELSWSAPVAFSLLSAIAAGALTNAALNKSFPRIKKPSSLAPKRIVIRKKDNKEEEEEDQREEEKSAYEKCSSEQQLEDATEFLVHLCMGSKSASKSELVDIVHAVAQGRGEEFTTNMLELGFDSAMNTIKGASEIKITPQQKQFAIGYCVKSAALNPVIQLLAAAEYNDMAPRFTKIASLQNEACEETLIKIAGLIGAWNRMSLLKDNDIEFVDTKQAANLSIADILSQINLPDEEEGTEDDVENEEDLNTEDSIDSSEEKQVNDRKPLSNTKVTPEIIDELDSDDDFIDEALSSPITPAKAVAAESHDNA